MYIPQNRVDFIFQGTPVFGVDVRIQRIKECNTNLGFLTSSCQEDSVIFDEY